MSPGAGTEARATSGPISHLCCSAGPPDNGEPGVGTEARATSGPGGSALGAAPSPDKSAERVCLLTASARAATDVLPGVIPPYPPRAPEASAAPSG